MATKTKQAKTTVNRRDENIKVWLYALADEMEKLTPWEQDFLENVDDWWNQGNEISERQYKRLEELYRRIF